MAANIIRYEHHGWMVSVQEHLKGKHQEHCLCFRCKRFRPDLDLLKCRIAQELFEFDVRNGCVTPVWECPIFVENERFRVYPDGTQEKI